MPAEAWHILKRLLLVMKLTTLLLIITLVQVSAKGFSQNINLDEKDAPLKEVLQSIEKQSGYTFFYDTKDLPDAKITVQLKNASIDEAVKQSIKGLPLTYKIVKTNVVLTKIEPSNKSSDLPPPPITVHGNVTDEKGQPIPNASVRVKKTGLGTITNEKGEFTLKNIDENAVLVISFIGYLTKEVNAIGDLSNIKLEVSNGKLDEVKVIAYGTSTERLSTGDVTTVSAKEIGEQPVNNPLLALEGRVPGMIITQNNGLPGSAVTVMIRGQNSINNGTYPFYVIDGVPYMSSLLPSVGTILGNDGQGGQGGLGNVSGNPLNYINPADIESISVLKDADATAIYGSRAANGAIIITTKRGKAGATKVDVNADDGWGKVASKLDVLNTAQYLEMRHEALNNDGITPSLSNGDYDLLLWNTARYTDWQKELIGGTSHYNDRQVSVSGGNASTQFLIGGGFHSETSVFPGNFDDQKGSLHFNINNVSSNQKFHIQFTGSYLVDNNKLPGTDLTRLAILLPPDAPALYNPDGSLNWTPGPNGYNTWPGGSNPLAYLNQKYSSLANNLVSNAVVRYIVLPGLEISSSFGYTNTQVDESNTTPAISHDPALLPYYGISARTSSYVHNSTQSWIVEPQATYTRNVGKGKFSALIGATINQNTNSGQVLNATGFNSDLQLENPSAASVVSVFSTLNSVYKYSALFGRLNYNWNDKFLVNLTSRRDGSSRFGPANQFHDFEAAGLGYIFSEEAFVKRAIPFLSFGKLRGSYGTTGSDQIGDYQFMDLYQTIYNYGAPYQTTTGLQVINLYNPNLAWELTKKSEGSLVLGFLNDRILLTTSYFQNRSSNELVGYSLPSLTGFLSITTNLPAVVRNSGWEFLLNTTNVKSKDFQWTSSFNLSIARNKLVSISSGMNSYYTEIVGHSLSTALLYHFLGVNPATGEYQFSTAKGDVTSTPASTDATILKDLNPKYYGGLQNSISYKRFQLDFLFQFVKQIKANYLFGEYPGSEGTNQPAWILNRWQQPGDIANIQRFNSNSSLNQQYSDANGSDAAYSDASFIRLKNLSLSWQMPNGWTKAAHLQNLRVYIQGQNLLTITHFKGLDPENGGTGSLPPLTMFTAGLQITL